MTERFLALRLALNLENEAGDVPKEKGGACWREKPWRLERKTTPGGWRENRQLLNTYFSRLKGRVTDLSQKWWKSQRSVAKRGVGTVLGKGRPFLEKKKEKRLILRPLSFGYPD